jgi:cell wall-associated NlpC family hydrolase
MMSENRNLMKYLKLIILSVTVLFIAYALYSKNNTQADQSNKTIILEEPLSIVETNTSLQDSILNFGKEFLGTPYVSAGCNVDGFDCSGFVYFVFQHFKINVPRSSADFENFGKEIPIENVQKGDILLFLSPTRNVIGHVGIVLNPKGIESDFIHASSGKEMKVIITSLSNQGYTKRFIKAVRVL